ncbi:hypothetical protein HS1genome_0219 [Sulfodiicoccus acidiphilus]|uniref:Uncharacterized protein n=1 Tax=Sulfodiicoccus acidiphilus TaxID=1670455 RepID=A0A348B0X8_9CREN|nr:hypothetical protein HS1genome_0219 [Sulfodiicoccus acidiphilus]GGU02331.1 hypothetical protein GCM10007116_19200 [Sulfodiicoccus acidiphilus]
MSKYYFYDLYCESWVAPSGLGELTPVERKPSAIPLPYCSQKGSTEPPLRKEIEVPPRCGTHREDAPSARAG